MTGNIDPVILHYSDGPGIHTMCFHTRAVDFCILTGKEPKVAFRYLATAAITGA